MAIDSVILEDGTFRKRFKLSSIIVGSVNDSLSLIEGIGYTGGVFRSIIQMVGFEGGSHLVCNNNGMNTEYNYPSFGLANCDLPTSIAGIQTENIESLSPQPCSKSSYHQFTFSICCRHYCCV